MPNGNEITIKGGSLKIKYKRSQFKNNGDEDTHQSDVRITRVEITGDINFAEDSKNGKCTVTIHYQ